MVFNSPIFLVFFCCFFPLYWCLHGNARLRLSLIASYFFYGWWDYRFLSLLLLSTVLDYGVGIGLSRTENDKLRRALICLSVVANLGILAIFKYFNFFIESLQAVGHQFGMTFDWPTLHILLPVGISFYTFQTLSYTIDVYRRELPVEKDFLRFAVFVAFFPQLVAGPIVRASELLPQLKRDRIASWAQMESGFGQALLGFFKKVAIADTLAVVVDPCFLGPEEYNALNMAIVIALYAVQIYCDFSGYSDIAIGIARMMGFELTPNFRFPYFATSPSDFWKRWHISLSSWLRDYLYIPLGGSRHGLLCRYRNLALTMLLGGLWHGANWTFIAWGGLHGFYLILEKEWQRIRNNARSSSKGSASLDSSIARAIQQAGKVAIMFLLVCFTWVFFRSSSMGHAWVVLARLADWDELSPSSFQLRIPLMTSCLLSVILFVSEFIFQQISWHKIKQRMPAISWWAYAVLLWMIAFFGTFDGRAFIYFQF